MNATDLIGFVGVFLILTAYFLNINNRIDSSDVKYILLNLIGAGLACLASILLEYYPFVLLEGIWTLVSLIALIKHYLHQKNKLNLYGKD